RRASNQRPSRLGLSRGRTISVKDAVLALVTKSANDAAVVIAESIGGTERKFAQLMTRRAAALGMRQTYFANASGLHHGQQWTTARDMAILAEALIRDFPTEYRYFSTASFRWHGRRYENHNALLASYSGVDGIKTGYIRQSGFNLVASAERDGRRIIGVVLGNPTQEVRDWRMTRLLTTGSGAERRRMASNPGRSVCPISPWPKARSRPCSTAGQEGWPTRRPSTPGSAGRRTRCRGPTPSTAPSTPSGASRSAPTGPPPPPNRL
ncbi:MAG TPA: D-alanyl-D-alanine carboxypeptidase, partial [Alphaproteobacteria bacterium]|nr:D-alanyl-D-alanine carboxypeptidase [Alphaproteobacteria bacterium]